MSLDNSPVDSLSAYETETQATVLPHTFLIEQGNRSVCVWNKMKTNTRLWGLSLTQARLIYRVAQTHHLMEQRLIWCIQMYQQSEYTEMFQQLYSWGYLLLLIINKFVHGWVCLDNPIYKWLVNSLLQFYTYFNLCLTNLECFWELCLYLRCTLTGASNHVVLVTSGDKVHVWPQGGCTVYRSLLGVSESFEAPRRQCSWKKTSYMKEQSNVYESHSSKALPDVICES